jgi:hypothetical protein
LRRGSTSSFAGCSLGCVEAGKRIGSGTAAGRASTMTGDGRENRSSCVEPRSLAAAFARLPLHHALHAASIGRTVERTQLLETGARVCGGCTVENSSLARRHSLSNGRQTIQIRHSFGFHAWAAVRPIIDSRPKRISTFAVQSTAITLAGRKPHRRSPEAPLDPCRR